MDKFRSNMKGKAMQVSRLAALSRREVSRLAALSRREVRNALNGSQQCNDSFTR